MQVGTPTHDGMIPRHRLVTLMQVSILPQRRLVLQRRLVCYPMHMLVLQRRLVCYPTTGWYSNASVTNIAIISQCWRYYLQNQGRRYFPIFLFLQHNIAILAILSSKSGSEIFSDIFVFTILFFILTPFSDNFPNVANIFVFGPSAIFFRCRCLQHHGKLAHERNLAPKIIHAQRKLVCYSNEGWYATLVKVQNFL
jgi:hypothetical protein